MASMPNVWQDAGIVAVFKEKTMLKALITTVGLLTLTTEASAVECRCQSIPGSAETVLQGTSESGTKVQLRFEANPVKTTTNLAFMCTDPAAVVSLAKLWMPDMDHGSSPTRLVSSGNCTRVERVNFIMPGVWDLQIKLDVTDPLTLSLPVVR